MTICDRKSTHVWKHQLKYRTTKVNDCDSCSIASKPHRSGEDRSIDSTNSLIAFYLIRDVSRGTISWFQMSCVIVHCCFDLWSVIIHGCSTCNASLFMVVFTCTCVIFIGVVTCNASLFVLAFTWTRHYELFIMVGVSTGDRTPRKTKKAKSSRHLQQLRPASVVLRCYIYTTAKQPVTRTIINSSQKYLHITASTRATPSENDIHNKISQRYSTTNTSTTY